MTIALGFKTTDGLIICADSQQSIGDMKTYDGKADIYVFPQPKLIVAMAGAGHDDYIRTAKAAVVSAVKRKAMTTSEVEVSLKEKLLEFFDVHLSRWSSFAPMDRPSVELLIGVTGEKIHPVLYHYEGTSFAEVHMKAIGLGIILAQNLLNRYHGVFTSGEAATLGTYILDKVKNGVEKCGGATHIVGLKKGMDFALTEDREIELMEMEIKEIEREGDRKFIEAIKSKPLPLMWNAEHAKRMAQLKAQNKKESSA